MHKRNIIIKNIKKSVIKFSFSLIFILLYLISPAQRMSVDDYTDEEDVKDFNRYAHLGLSTFEWWSIVIGIVLILIAREINNNQKGISTLLFVIGGLAVLPLVLVILALAQKAIGYGIALAAILAVLYFLFGKK